MTSVSPARILMVLAGDDEKAAAFGIDEPRALAASYYLFGDQRAEVVFASEHGGFPAIAGQMRRFSTDPDIARFLDDQNARSEIADSLSLTQIVVDDFDALVLFMACGGVAPAVVAVIAAFVASGKVVVLPHTYDVPIEKDEALVIVRREGDAIAWTRNVMKTMADRS